VAYFSENHAVLSSHKLYSLLMLQRDRESEMASKAMLLLLLVASLAGETSLYHRATKPTLGPLRFTVRFALKFSARSMAHLTKFRASSPWSL